MIFAVKLVIRHVTNADGFMGKRYIRRYSRHRLWSESTSSAITMTSAKGTLKLRVVVGAP
jgi:hypothetical protein